MWGERRDLRALLSLAFGRGHLCRSAGESDEAELWRGEGNLLTVAPRVPLSVSHSLGRRVACLKGAKWCGVIRTL